MPANEKVYPNNELEGILHSHNIPVKVMWEIPGPRNTAVAWLTCLLVKRTLVIVETYDTGGWEALVQASDSIRTDDTINTVLTACGVRGLYRLNKERSK